MADIVGVDHVSIGTTSTPRREASRITLRGGFAAEEVGKIADGNYMRTFRVVVG